MYGEVVQMRQEKFSLSFLLLIFSLLAVASPLGANSGQSRRGVLLDVAISPADNTLEVKVLCSYYTYHREREIADPNRLVVDLFNIEGILAKQNFEINDFGIWSIRLGMYQPTIARVVFEIQDGFPQYKVERIANGVIISFWKKQTASAEEKEEKGGGSRDEESAAKEGKTAKEIAEGNTQEQGPPVEETSAQSEKETNNELERIAGELEEAKKTIAELKGTLNQLKLEVGRLRKKFFRIETVGSYFRPEEQSVRDVYPGGMMLGAELSLGIGDLIEVWLAEKYFHKSVVDSVSGEEKKISLIPIETGLKLRLNKGFMNPYLGAGVGYYQYKEVLPTGEVKDNKLGYIGQAGCFFKIKGGLLVDIYAHYSYSKVSSGAQIYNIGGLHFGAGFGFEF